MEKYDHKKIEKKWQKYWEKNQLAKAIDNDKKPKFYSLIEFPYPSAEGLHVGHIRSNTAMDIICRKRRMQGYNVLYPIGWDAFGLPTENYAIKTGIHPAVVTKKNTDTFRRQLKEVGFSFDWDREINTTDPAYYKWTQWIFLQFLKHGLAYKKKLAINWCPSCKIGLANEEVVDGNCERCGTPVEKRNKEQWLLAITKYADRLDRDLDIKKILIGTRNEAKVKMIRTCLAGVKGLNLVSLNDLPPIDDSALVEGDDFKKNANLKSEFYFKKTGLPTISTDHILWIEKWPKNNGLMFHIRKHANPKSSRASDSEVITFLKNFLQTVGGQSRANFHYAISYTDEKGTTQAEAVPFNYILQTEEARHYWPGYPTEALLKDPITGFYKSEQPDQIRYAKVRDVLMEKFVPLMFADYTPIDYLEKIRVQQKNWIGRSEGVDLRFKVKDLDIYFEMYDSIPQTHMAQTFVVIAPDHPKLAELVKGIKSAEAVMRKAKEIVAKRIAGVYEKTGEMDGIFTGRYVEYAPANRDLPIWVASYVVADYGTGVVSCSVHDERDYIFAKKYKIPLHPVLFPKDKELAEKVRKQEIFYRQPDGILEEPKQFKGRRWDEAREDIINYLVKNGWAKRAVNYKLRDWIFSRQHYWGEPIPVVFCENCQNKKYNFIFIHGYDSTCKTPWKLWLKNELEKRGHSFFGPELPNTAKPKVEKQANFILQNAKIGKDTIIIGHSLGGTVMMKILEQTKVKIARAVFLDAVLRPKFNDKERPEVAASSDWKVDFKKIKKAADEFVVLADENFSIIPKDQSEELGKIFDAKVMYVRPSDRHFSRAETEPEVLKLFDNNGIVPIPEKDLPVELPKVEKYQPTDTGESPLAGITEWVNTKCPRCGGPAKRETDTMPNWAGSSWYYLRYIDPKNKKAFADFKKLEYWTPVDWYNGGMEHTTLHLLYSRFWHKFLFDLGLVPTSEPYAKRTSHGMILAEGGVKMSKSKGNVINPDEIVKKFGADALRVYEMFMGPFDQAIVWSTDGLSGAKRFLEKIWHFYHKVKLFDCGGAGCNKAPAGLPQMVHKTIKKVTEDIENFHFNTAISQMMIFMNFVSRFDAVPRGALENFLKILAPFAPHLSEELWAELGNKKSIFLEAWPKYNPELVRDQTINLVIQVNSRVRDTVEVSSDISEKEAEKIALASEKVKKWLEGKEVIKVIFVKGKLVNIVIK